MNRIVFGRFSMRFVLFILPICFSILRVDGQVVPQTVLDAEIYYSWDKKRKSWIPGERTTYGYDSLGNTIESAIYTWDEEQDFWNGLRRYLFGHDSLGNVESEKGFSWDPQAGDWSPGGQVCSEEASVCEELPALWETHRDAGGEIIAEAMYRWNVADQQFVMYRSNSVSMDDQGRYIEYSAMELDTAGDTWIENFHADIFYDSLGNRSSIERYSWNPEREAMMPVDSIRLSYDSLGNQTEQIIHVPDGTSGQWVPSEFYQVAYDSMGNAVTYRVYSWDTGIPDWDLSYRLEYAYDSLGNNTEYIYYTKEDMTSREVPTWRSVNAYDTAGNLVESTGYYWNPRIAYWSRYSRETMSYDTTGYNTGSMSYSWDNTLNDWRPDAGNRSERIFDTQGNVVEETSQYWDTREKEWINEWKMERYWSGDLLREQFCYTEESAPGGSVLGRLAVGSAYQDEVIRFSLVPGGDDGLFVVDSIPGGYFLLLATPLDFEARQVHYLSVAARLDHAGEITADTAQYTVFVRNVNDNAPVMGDTAFSIAEDVAGAKNLGRVAVADPDGDLNPFRFSVVSGDSQGIFRMTTAGGVVLSKFDSIDYEKQDTYLLTVRVSDGLFYGEGTVTVHILDVEEPTTVVPSAPADFRLYPNPASGTIRLECPDGQHEVAITSPNGILLYQSEFPGTTHLVDISSFNSGVYFLTITSEGQVVTKKVIRY